MITLKLMVHDRNQYGRGVSLVKYQDGKLVDGFVLHNFPDMRQQLRYTSDLHKMTGWEIEDWTGKTHIPPFDPANLPT